MPFIKLRGLPWSCTEEDIITFLNGIKITERSLNQQINQPDAMNGESPEENNRIKPAVYLTTNSEGRPSGEAFIEVESDADVEIAKTRHNAKIGQRYIEGITNEKFLINMVCKY